jgi:DNA repair protein RecO (recombination protein O)
MSIEKTKAIVLRTYKLGETSRIVVAYTMQFGKLRLVAKGIRRPKSQFGASLEPLTESSIVFYLREERDLLTVSQATIERPFLGFQRDLERLAYGSAVLELVDSLVSEREADREIYCLFRATLEAMETCERDDLEVFLWAFEIALTCGLGYTPVMDRCVVCGETDKDIIGFSPSLGGMICEGCWPEKADIVSMSYDTIEFFRKLIYSGLAGADELKPPATVRREMRRALRDFVDHHTDRKHRLKSLELLEELGDGTNAERSA